MDINSQVNTLEVTTFFEPESSTFSYIAADLSSGYCAVIDPVLNFDYASGSIHRTSAEEIIEFIHQRGWQVQWLIETHVHADHLSAGPFIQAELGGKLAIGEHIIQVQETFGKIFNAGTEFERTGAQFDYLFQNNDRYKVGNIEARAVYTPGHTPACVTHIIGDAVFVGDTLFMPDAGTARADFPGGDAGDLFDSVQKILALPDHYRLFMCHDYQPNGRPLQNQTTVAEQRQHNIHVGHGTQKAEFIELRQARDRTLSMPTLILPALQVNMRAGHLPPQEDNGTRYLKIPIDCFK
jgi:glyoxylase-like metal-dependent hydrolase (beta-lactamase superfamily II)